LIVSEQSGAAAAKPAKAGIKADRTAAKQAKEYMAALKLNQRKESVTDGRSKGMRYQRAR
jgi:hypothetical protein